MSAFAPDIFRGKRFAVLGLGRNGLPTAQALSAMGAEVTAWDDKPEAREAATGTELRDLAQGSFDFDGLVLSPGIPHRLPQPHPVATRAIESGVPVLCDIDLLYLAVRASGSRARFAGITGTNGKSTTTALLAHILQTAGTAVAAGGNLGPAALSLPLLPHDGVYVLEMSSYMLERIARISFSAAAMLNLSVDHLDRHGDMAGYAGAKRAIFDRQVDGDLAVIGIDDALSLAMAEELGRDAVSRRVVRISGTEAPLVQGAALPGTHNAQNANAATAMARFFGVADPVIADALGTFPGLPHRQQQVVTVNGITFINDSKATNADAAARALGCYDRVIWIVGGIAKEGGIESLVPLFPRSVHTLVIGQDALMLARTLAKHQAPFSKVYTMDRAVRSAFRAATDFNVPVVLLSPACASWDQYTGYDDRGNQFASLARALQENA